MVLGGKDRTSQLGQWRQTAGGVHNVAYDAASSVGDNVVQNNAQHEGKAGEGTGHEPSSRFSSMILMFEAALPPGSSKS